MAGEDWVKRGASNDKRNPELVKMPEGKRVTYDELLALADPKIADVVNAETCIERQSNLQNGLDELERRFGQASPDVVVMFGDDQSEWFFEDNYPTINVYWGDSVHIQGIPPNGPFRHLPTEDMEWPVDSELGLHVIESLMERDFDISQSRYQKEAYGGSIGPATWYLDMKRSTEPRPFGLLHAYSFPINRWFAGKKVPILPITINTCYPPNWISPRRAYALGQAVREAVDNWASDKKVAFACSGGLSHFVVDEDIDQMALKGMTEANGEILSSLPRHRLQSATTEILNWVATAAAMGKPMDLITYEPCYRSPAGTGVGCAVGHWEGNSK
jgi:hypothetical protein